MIDEILLIALAAMVPLIGGPIARLLQKREQDKLDAIWRAAQESSGGTGTHKKLAGSGASTGSNPTPAEPKGAIVLGGFAVILITFGALTLYRNRDYVRTHLDDYIFWGWLFVAMVAGMIVNVLATNYKTARKLWEIEVSQVVYPLLFSVFVFYPVLAASDASHGSLFPYYTAFLNGYCWKSIVAHVKPPAAEAKS